MFLYLPIVKFLIILLWASGMIATANAGNKAKADSLAIVLQSAKEDSDKVNLLLSLAIAHLYDDSLKTIEGIREAYSLTEKISCAPCLCKVNYSYGKFYERFNNYDTALAYFMQVESCWEKLGNNYEIPVALNSIGNIYKIQGNYEKASETFMRSLAIEEKNKDTRGIAVVNNNLGTVYQRQNLYDKAMEYYTKALAGFEQLADSENCAKIINNIGIISWYKGDLKQALGHYQRTISIWEKLNREDMISAVYTNIGIVYYYLNEKEKTLEYFHKSLALRIKFNDKREMSAGYGNIAELYMETGKLDKAVEYSQKSLELAKEIGIKEEIKYAYHTLALAYGKKGDYKEAFENFRNYSDMKDSLVNEVTTGKISELEAKYENEKKKRQIEIQELKLGQQELELNKKQLTIYAVSFGLLLMLGLAFVVYSGYRQKKKMNSQLTEKNKIIEQKNKDITDSIEYAKTLQDAMLPDIGDVVRALPGSFIFFKPRDIVSGDFYWYHKKENAHYIIAADCTGHGVPGAFVSITCSNILNDVIIHKGFHETGKILSEVNRGIYAAFKKEGRRSQSNDGMDVAVLKLEKSGSIPELEFSGAMNGALVVRGNEIIELPADKRPAGGFTPPEYNFNTHKFALAKNDSVYIFSDGFHDQFGGEQGKKFMYRRFKETLLQIAPLTPGNQVVKLEETLRQWQGAHEQVDDILVIGIKA